MTKRKTLCLVVSSEMTVKAFLKEHVIALSKRYDVTLIVNTDRNDFAEQNGLSIKVIPIAIVRAINPFADIMALFRLLILFHSHHFDLVHSVTPKAGLLAMLAGRMTGIPFRVHTFTGQVWATRHGFSRILLKCIDRLLASSATHLLADSFSQRQFILDQRITRADKLSVLADGSISGVDTEKFKPSDNARAETRKQLGLPNDSIVILFLGRLLRDKGVIDLASAFGNISAETSHPHLLLVGPDEGELTEEIKHAAGKFADRISFIAYTDKPESYFAAADLFCLPSYREGFGSVIVEAAACGIPAIGSRIYGISDAIREEETGLLFQPGDITELAGAIARLVSHPELRCAMGKAARLRAQNYFSSKRLTQAWLTYYDGLIQNGCSTYHRDFIA